VYNSDGEMIVAAMITFVINVLCGCKKARVEAFKKSRHCEKARKPSGKMLVVADL
jgi:hypothetical protein